VHIDGVGPMEVNSLHGEKGAYTFRDHGTRAVFVYLYKWPREVYSIIVQFNQRLKSYWGGSLKLIKTD